MQWVSGEVYLRKYLFVLQMEQQKVFHYVHQLVCNLSAGAFSAERKPKN